MRGNLMKTLLLLALLIYIVSPLDVIPDLLGPLGRVDDLILVALFVWRYYFRLVRQSASSTAGPEPRTKNTHRSRTDPYSILKLSPEASLKEIEEQYRSLMKQYHPDRVAHLGEDLRKLAHEKTVEIQRAYQTLVSRT
jgi:DnaJ like chaperone protein